jgi:hypothetical protein
MLPDCFEGCFVRIAAVEGALGNSREAQIKGKNWMLWQGSCGYMLAGIEFKRQIVECGPMGQMPYIACPGALCRERRTR